MSYFSCCCRCHTQALKTNKVSYVGSMVQSVHGERKNQSVTNLKQYARGVLLAQYPVRGVSCPGGGRRGSVRARARGRGGEGYPCPGCV